MARTFQKQIRLSRWTCPEVATPSVKVSQAIE
jgi:hypothetical protein